MLDTFERPITYLRISVTDRCNFRCRYCMPEEGVEMRVHSDMCSFEELRDIAAAAVRCGINKIRVTGGEPLVRRGIVDFCRMLSALEGLEELCLTTNGSLLPALARPLREAGLHRLNISLDTLRPERFRFITRLGSLAQTLEGIHAAEEAGFEDLKLNCVLLGGVNEDEIVDFVNLTREKPWQIRFIEKMPIGNRTGWGSYIPAQTVLEKCPELEPIECSGVAACYHLPGAAGTVGLITPMSHAFCSSCNRIRVTADGKLKFCLHAAGELPLRGLRGEELEAAIRKGILMKPRQHHMEVRDSAETDRAMYEIGG